MERGEIPTTRCHKYTTSMMDREALMVNGGSTGNGRDDGQRTVITDGSSG